MTRSVAINDGPAMSGVAKGTMNGSIAGSPLSAADAGKIIGRPSTVICPITVAIFAIAAGEEVGRYVRTIFDSDDVLSQLRTVQAIVTHLETFPAQRARAACLRAAHFGSYRYGTLKMILRRGLDLEPLPAPQPPALPQVAPRFTRPPTSWRH